MRRFALIVSLVLSTLALSATTAWADQPTHSKASFSGSFSVPAGELCDFAYHETFTVDINEVDFGDPNNPTKLLAHETVYVTHTNLDTAA